MIPVDTRSHANSEQPSGVQKAIDVVSKANDHEKKLLEAAYKGLKDNIAKGVDFANNPPPSK